MAIRDVLKMGDPRLLESSESVTVFDTNELHQLISDMRDTMVHLNGAGLAAPQIGVMKRVVIFSMATNNPRYPNQEAVPDTVLINPVIEALTDQTSSFWEGCLSVPGMRGLVARPTKVRYYGFDQIGQPIERVVEGFHATVVQHECDHLDGILYPMRINDMRQFGFETELAKG